MRGKQNKPKRINKPPKEDPWKNVVVNRGKLAGGILTDEMISAIFPSGSPKFTDTLIPLRMKSVSGGKTPIRPR